MEWSAIKYNIHSIQKPTQRKYQSIRLDVKAIRTDRRRFTLPVCPGSLSALGKWGGRKRVVHVSDLSDWVDGNAGLLAGVYSHTEL